MATFVAACSQGQHMHSARTNNPQWGKEVINIIQLLFLMLLIYQNKPHPRQLKFGEQGET